MGLFTKVWVGAGKPQKIVHYSDRSNSIKAVITLRTKERRRVAHHYWKDRLHVKRVTFGETVRSLGSKDMVNLRQFGRKAPEE